MLFTFAYNVTWLVEKLKALATHLRFDQGEGMPHILRPSWKVLLPEQSRRSGINLTHGVE
jgi:hypothetical protein